MEILGQLLPFIALFAIMYFVIIRPQQQQVKKHKEMLEALKKGDKVVTNGGLIVEIKQVQDDHFMVKINKESDAKIVKDSIARKYEDEA